MKPKLEDTLKGGFGGLYGEVVTHDCYRLRSLKFVPDVIFDIGANIGVFTRFARTLFPQALIVAVEPDPENASTFRTFTPFDPNLVLEQKALGAGQIYHGTTHRNGSGATYLSAGLGYPKEQMDLAVTMKNGLELSSVESMTLGDIVWKYWRIRPAKYLMKIDCEGAENTIWEDDSSMAALRAMDYIAMEVHWYALHGAVVEEVNKATSKALHGLGRTHNCHLDGVHFWATKR